MNNDVECPYCGADLEINHDDGYGYEEGRTHQQECGNCEKTFVYTTSIMFSYEAEKADCLNGANHDYRPTTTYPRIATKMECTICANRRELTAEERQNFETLTPKRDENN